MTHEQMYFCCIILAIIPHIHLWMKSLLQLTYRLHTLSHISPPTPVQNPQDHMLVWNKHIVVQTLAVELEILLLSNGLWETLIL